MSEKLPMRVRDVLRGFDEYINHIRKTKGTDPQNVYATPGQFSYLAPHADKWNVSLWKNGDGIEYRGFPVRVIRT